MCELQLTQIMNQEQHLQEVCSNFTMIISKLKTEFNSVKESLDIAHARLSEIELISSIRTPTEAAGMAERLDSIQQTVTRLDAEVDYLNNQTRRNNWLVDGVKELTGETWDVTESKGNTP